MKKKLIIGISTGVLVILGIVLTVVFMPKKNEPVVNEEVKEEVQENKEIAKVSMSDEEKYDYILKANGKSKDECLIEKMDVDFDGVDEFVYYPDKTLVYLGTMKIYGGEEFKEIVDLEKCMGLYKIELLEDKNTKEKVCILNVRTADGFCYHYESKVKLVKNGDSFTTQELFLNSCDSEQEELVNANVVKDDDRKCVEQYLVNGKKVSEDEYNKAKKKFEEKYKVVDDFDIHRVNEVKSTIVENSIESTQSTDEIKVKYKKYEESIKDEENGKELVHILYTYPEFEEKIDLLRKLNKKYKDRLNEYEREKSNILSLAKNYYKKTEEDAILPFSIINDVSITYNKKNKLSIVDNCSDWWGEEFPVGDSNVEIENYNLISEKELTLKDINIDKADSEFENMVKENFKKEYNMEIDIEDLKFYLTDSGVIYSLGGHYEIGPYKM